MSTVYAARAACCLILLAVAGVALATTINVPADYATIQAAINAAADGDTIMIAAGTYHQGLNISSKHLTLQGAGKTTTFLDGTGLAVRGIYAHADVGHTTTITGLTVQNFGNTGVFIQAMNGLISGCAILNNRSVSATCHGLEVSGGDATMQMCEVSSNSADGIYLHSTVARTWNIGSTHVEWNTLNGIEATGSEGTPSTLVAGHNQLTGNGSDGLTTSGVIMTAFNSTVNGNQRSGIVGSRAEDQIVDNAVYANWLYGIESYGLVQGNTVTQNDSGLYVRAGTIMNNVVWCNGTSGSGGCGIYVYERIAPATVLNNSVASTGGSGGGIKWDSDLASPGTIKNCIIAFNNDGSGVNAVNPAAAPTVTYSDVFSNLPGNFAGMTDPTGTNGNISLNPHFVKVELGRLYLKSSGGHWAPNGTWIADNFNSPCLDSGDPASDFANEPIPNGGRANMGAWGNTDRASKTPAKASPRVVAYTPQGTSVSRTVPITMLFDIPMARVSVEGGFKVNPAKAGTFTWLGKKVTWTPTTPFGPGTTYTVRLFNSAMSTERVHMTSNFEWQFTARAAGAPGIAVAAMPTAAGVEIETNLCSPASVSVTIANLAGRTVAVLADRDLPAGASTLLWNRRSSAGTTVPPGQYLVRVTARTADGGQVSAVTTVRLP